MANKNRSYLLLGAVVVGSAYLLMQNGERAEVTGPDIQQQAEVLEAKGMTDALSRLATRSVAGNYLAARFAVSSDDLYRANTFYNRALKSATASQSEELLRDRSLPVAIGAGDINGAVKIARELDWKKPTATAQLAVLVQLIDAFKQKDTKTAEQLLPFLRDDGFGRLLKPLIQTWHFVAQEKYAQAITSLENLTRNYPSLKPMVQMHLAFVYQVQGNMTEAEHYYKLAAADNLSVRSAYLIAQFYESTGKKEEAQVLYKELGDKMPGSPLPKLIEARIAKGNLHKQSVITSAADGVSAALYDVATVLYQESSGRLAVLYAQLSHHLTPDEEFIALLLGDILSSMDASEQAEAYFKAVPASSDMHVLAQMRLGQLYEKQKKYDDVIAILKGFEKNPLLTRQANMELGDLYRRKEDFVSAIPYYSNVIKEIRKPEDIDWVVYFARGICYERNDEWEKAEADLLQALELSPQQPEVLNYLAYSWADHGKNLKKALAMLEKALDGAPDDPYIADSVGWALHKNGRTEEAVSYIEAALHFLPDDSVVNDHLGDVYWYTGRRLEARYQWERALKNAKETDAKMLRTLEDKLKNGLPDREPVVVKTEKETTKQEPARDEAGKEL